MSSIYSQSPSPPRHRDTSDQDDDDRNSVRSGDARSPRSEDARSPRSGDERSEASGDEQQQRPQNSGDEEDKNKKEKKKVTKRKGPVRRMVISDDMLTGPKGLQKLDEKFKEFEFRGKGRETEDLNRILNNFEQWIHTLHPKHPFDQCLERIEFIGLKKKSLKTYMSKMRMGMLPTYADHVDPMFDDDDSNPLPIFENEEGEREEQTAAAASSNRSLAELSDSDIPTMEEQMEMESISQIDNAQEKTIIVPQSGLNEDLSNSGVPSLDEQIEMEELMSNNN